MNVLSQEESKSTIAGIARSYKNKIVLKYFPTKLSVVNEGLKLGYVIQKATTIQNVANEKLIYRNIAGTPFIKWGENTWNDALNKLSTSQNDSSNLAFLAKAIADSLEQSIGKDILGEDLKSLRETKSKNDNTFSYLLLAVMQSHIAAQGLGLWVEDTDVIFGKTYVYRIRINKTNFTADDWFYIKASCKDFNENSLRSDTAIKVKEEDKAINFSFAGKDDFFAFNVYRKKEIDMNYLKLNQSPIINLVPQGSTVKAGYGYLDSGLVNYTKYQYKVTVLTPFADELVLGEFVAIPKDKTPPAAPSLVTAKHKTPNEVEISWQINLAENKDLKGFNIGRSNKEDGQYKKINKQLVAASATNFIDKEFTVDGQNFYVVEALDTAGNSIWSFPAYVTLIDSTPPAKPIISSAIIDSVGKVIISLKPNTEIDFMGYQLLKANSADHEFSVVSQTFNDSIIEKVFVLYDSTTLNTLTKNIYYKVVGFDTHFNQSEDSKIIELKRRDTIPPVAPVITDYILTDSSITILFENSSSEDVTENLLLRRVIGKEKFDTIFRNTNASIINYEDKNFTATNSYEYCMVAKDGSNLYSKPSTFIVLKPIENKRLVPPILNLLYSKKDNTVSIKVDNSDKYSKQKTTITLYCRYAKNEEWRIVKIEKLDKINPIIHQLLKGTTEAYFAAIITDEKGKKSSFSREEKINY